MAAPLRRTGYGRYRRRDPGGGQEALEDEGRFGATVLDEEGGRGPGRGACEQGGERRIVEKGRGRDRARRRVRDTPVGDGDPSAAARRTSGAPVRRAAASMRVERSAAARGSVASVGSTATSSAITMVATANRRSASGATPSWRSGPASAPGSGRGSAIVTAEDAGGGDREFALGPFEQREQRGRDERAAEAEQGGLELDGEAGQAGGDAGRARRPGADVAERGDAVGQAR